MAAAPSGHAHWQYTRWGMTVDEVVAASGNKAHAAANGPGNSTSSEKNLLDVPYQAGRFSFTVNFMFDANKRLRTVKLNLDNPKKDCVPLTGELLNTYGPSKQAETAVSEVHRWWDKPNGNVVMLFSIGDVSCSVSYNEFKEAGSKGGL